MNQEYRAFGFRWRWALDVIDANLLFSGRGNSRDALSPSRRVNCCLRGNVHTDGLCSFVTVNWWVVAHFSTEQLQGRLGGRVWLLPTAGTCAILTNTYAIWSHAGLAIGKVITSYDPMHSRYSRTQVHGKALLQLARFLFGSSP
jgi:hypothetical protein